MMEHKIQWTAPSPLWREATLVESPDAQRKMREPAILRFSADSFMEDFLKIVESDPDQLRNLVAIKETWRGPVQAKGPAALLEPKEPQSSFARRLSRARATVERVRAGSSFLAATGQSRDR